MLLKTIIIVAALAAGSAFAGVTSSHETKEQTEMKKRPDFAFIPRRFYDPLKCKTITKQEDCNTCEYTKCWNKDYIWTDDLMRCTTKDCSNTVSSFIPLDPDTELSGHLDHEDDPAAATDVQSQNIED